ncbi:HAD-IA family hydrolase [Occallatibacter savannae]|uniref:HAD-IA family hydrolase n=1 Tax=Occallatibacter savannae TaxID=1002691 RepID=UPI0013A5A9BE|nr:HAD-IA family hydrolase [Occallatibacter savannae]
MFPFDVILFDIGGVLLTNGWDHHERSVVAGQLNLDRDILESRHAKAFEPWERGELTLSEYLDAVVFYEPRAFSRDEFFSSICSQSKELPSGALCILKELAASDKCRIGALNNEARETHEFRMKKFGLHDLFKYTFTSCYMGLRKPDPKIYVRALGILGDTPERALFIDDRLENVAAAAAVGMKAIQFTGETELRQQLGELAVL